MPRPRRWTDEQLILAVKRSKSLREVVECLGVRPGGGTYKGIRLAAERLGLDISGFPQMKDGRVAQRRRWTDDELKETVAASQSLSEVARRLGYTPNGGIHRWLRAHFRRLEIDTSHFLGQGWSKGRARPGTGFKARPLTEVLVEHSPLLTTAGLLKRLVAAELKRRLCEECGIDSWQGKPLTLHLDHINGDHSDNRLENLRVLCPNCHSQTPTWCAGNRKARARSDSHADPTGATSLLSPLLPLEEANMDDPAGVLQRQRGTV